MHKDVETIVRRSKSDKMHGMPQTNKPPKKLQQRSKYDTKGRRYA